MSLNGGFAKQFGIPEIPDGSRTLPLDGRYVRSFTDLAQIWDKDRMPIPPGQILQFGGSITGVVMFIDIGGFTRRSHDLTPAQTAYWVNRFYDSVWPECEAAHATVDKVIGDCLMLVLSPRLGCDDPLRKALELALQILRRDVYGYYPHMGIAEGSFWIGYSGPPPSMSISVYGEVVNLAARLTKAVGERSVGMVTTQWDLLKVDIDPGDRFQVENGVKPLSDFEQKEYVKIQRDSLWIPQCQLPPLMRISLEDSEGGDPPAV